MTIQIHKRTHLLTWRSGKLVHKSYCADPARFPREWLRGVSERSFGAVAKSPIAFLGGKELLNRSKAAALAECIVVVDLHGQLMVFDRMLGLVCMFFVFHSKLAGWMPDGTCFGPAWMIVGPETSEAREKIGQALLAATEAGKGVSS
jgi:hypothetical protein